jgi:TnsA endonuclease N terminal
MANNYTQGYFTPLNPTKYIGNNQPKYRSGWELTVMRFCDTHPAVIGWASECLRIPYRNPFTGKDTTYYPDFLITYQDKNGNKISEIIEVKPKTQAVLELAKSQQEKAAVVLNMAKWEACRAWCQRHGMKFRILTEEDIYNNWQPRSKPKQKRARK